MFRNEPNRLKRLFGNNDIIFIGKDKYFKINFYRIEDKDYKRLANKFKIFIIKICKDEEFDIDDVDTSAETDSSEVIAAKIVDKIELSKGVDLTPKVAIATQASNIRKANFVKPSYAKATPAKVMKMDKAVDNKRPVFRNRSVFMVLYHNIR